MIMNTKYGFSIWFSTCLLMFLSISCEEDFLDKNPLDKPSTQAFWTSDAEVESGLAGVYSRLQENFLGYERVYYDGLTDNAWCAGGSQGNISSMTTGSISPGLGGALENMYTSPYRAISGCNFFLDNVDKASGFLNEEELDLYKAEVRFIRALSYFDLVRLFGDVIIYRTYPHTLDEARIAKSPKDEVYAFIEEDLNYAISKLPDTKYTGRAVKGSAQGLMGKVLLTQEKWADAANILKQIIDGEKFSLSGNYKGLFLTAGQKNNPEIMFSTRYLAPNNVHRTDPGNAGMNIEMGWYVHLQPYRNLADAYEMTDGLPAGESPVFDTANPYANRDPRLDMTMKLPDEFWTNAAGDTVDNMFPSLTGGFLMEKYVNLDIAPFNLESAFETDQDLIHLRYADILLMYAEAKNEATGPDASVYDALNEVRRRTGVEMPDVDQSGYNTRESLREFIRHERRVELALEGHRYFDLKRWRIAHEVLPVLVTPNGDPLVFEQKNYYLPFTTEELDRNPSLVQTDGY